MATINGGKKLQEALDAIAKSVTKAATLKVGFLEGATYPDGTSVPMVAALLEFGHWYDTRDGRKQAGPWPYFRNMVAAKSPEWPDAIGNLLIANKYDADKTLHQAGMAIKGQLQQSIRDTNSPALKPSTIERKGFAKPLIETSHLINSVDYQVD